MANVDMQKKKSYRNRKRKFLKYLVSILLLAVLSVIAAVFVMGNGKLSVEGLKNLLSGAGSQAVATEFSFEAGYGSAFADIDGGLAICSSSGLRVYNERAELTYSELFEMGCPTLSAEGDTACAYDLGGLSLRLFNSDGIIKSLSTEDKIISANLSTRGYLTVCTQDSGYKGLVRVFDKKGDEVFKWFSAKGYILSAQVSPDNKSLAVLTLNEDGSRIVFFDLDGTDEKASSILSGSLVLEIRFINDNTVLAVAKNAIISMSTDGSSAVLKDYSDKYLTNYSIDSDGFFTVVLSDYLVGDQGGIHTVGKTGKLLGSLETTRNILSVSARGAYLAVLYSDGLVLYDENLAEAAHFEDTAGGEMVIMRSDDTALLVRAHSATVYSAKPVE